MSSSEEDEAPAAKKLRVELASSIYPTIREPDVVVVVGGREFREHSRHLRCFSDYFDAAFRSGMRESRIGRFEFPDQDPKEWPWIMSLLQPFSDEKLDYDSLPNAVKWFSLLCVPRGLDECDKVLLDKILEVQWTKSGLTKTILAFTLTSLDMSLKNTLSRSSTRCIEMITSIFQLHPDVIEKSHLTFIKDQILNHPALCQEKFWPLFAKFLPFSPKEPDHQLKMLRDDNSGMILALVYSELQRKRLKRELKESKLEAERIQSVIDSKGYGYGKRRA